MASRRVLTDEQLNAAVSELSDWSLVDGKLHRELRFGDFAAALAFMVRSGVALDARDHHPEWSNVYNRLVIDFVTHDADPESGITELDVEAAKLIDELYDS